MVLSSRTHAFTAWANVRLLQSGEPIIKNVLTDLLNGSSMVKLIRCYLGESRKKNVNVDSLTFYEKQNHVQKLIRQLKHDRILPEEVSFDSRFFATRNTDLMFNLLWCLVSRDIWLLWKQGAMILRIESAELLRATPLTLIEEKSKVKCAEKPGECTEQSSACFPPPESCILDMVTSQLKMTSEGCQLNCRTLSDLNNSHVLCALINAFIPEMLTVEVLLNDRWTTNLALWIIEEICEINSTFSSEDLIEDDKMAICTYFSFFLVAACRYRQCCAVTTELEHIRRIISQYECLMANIEEATDEKSLRKKHEYLQEIRNHTKSRQKLEKKFDTKKFSEWIKRVESIKEKVMNVVRQKIEDKFETVYVPREITIAKLCQTCGINLSLTTGHGYYLCQTPEIVTHNRDIVLKSKATGKFLSNKPNIKRKIRTLLGLWPSAPSQLYPLRYPEYEIYLESTSKNKQLPNGCSFLYQIFPSNDIHVKQRFTKAARDNETDTVLRMAQFFKEDPDFINWEEPKSGNTALHYSSRNGNKQMVQRLLEYNADIDCQNKGLCTPIHLAVRGGHFEIIHLLIEWGCDLSIKNAKEETVIESAKTPNLKQYITETHNYYSAMIPAIMNGDSDLLLSLIKEYMNGKKVISSLSSRCVSGSTLLHTAVYLGDTESIDCLLQLGVDPDIRDYKDATPLHRATDYTSSAILLEAGAKVNAEDNDGNTPLHIKCYEEDDNLEVITLLVESGADLTKRNKTGLLPIHCSAMKGQTDIIDYLLKADTGDHLTHALSKDLTLPSLMFLALSGGFLSCAHWLSEKGFCLLEREAEKLLFEIVCKSIKASNTDDILSFLFDSGVNVNFQLHGDNTALHYVCSLGSSNFVLKSLLDQGANPHLLNEKSMSPLMVAVKANNLKTVAILLEDGADMLIENDEGECALDFIQDPDEWIKFDPFPEKIRESIIAHYWQEARGLIHSLTAKVRSGNHNSLIKPPPLTLGHDTNSYNPRGNTPHVHHLPSIFVTSTQ